MSSIRAPLLTGYESLSSPPPYSVSASKGSSSINASYADYQGLDNGAGVPETIPTGIGEVEGRVFVKDLQLSDGEYTGWTKDGLPDGRGNKHYYDGTRFHEGDWKLGQRHGDGVYTWSGGKFTGKWENDKRVEGLTTYIDRSEFQGSYDKENDDQMKLRGELTFPDGIHKYNGSFRNDEYWTGIETESNGKTIAWVNGAPQSSGCCIIL